MESRAKALGHGIHPMMIVFPLGLFATAVIFDILYLITDRAGFQISAAYTIGAGVIGGLVAAVFGFTGLAGHPGRHPRQAGRPRDPRHRQRRRRAAALRGELVGTGVRAVNWEPSVLALVCSFAGIILSGMTAWLGGELVERLGIGVSDDAGVNASSSLSRRPTGRARA